MSRYAELADEMRKITRDALLAAAPAQPAPSSPVGELSPLTDEAILDAATKEFPDWREDIQEQFVLRVVRAALSAQGRETNAKLRGAEGVPLG